MIKEYFLNRTFNIRIIEKYIPRLGVFVEEYCKKDTDFTVVGFSRKKKG